MCGIAGFLSNDVHAPADEAAVARMTAALAHRGPDASGAWKSGPCALGHRRLSIIDLSVEANQPLLNETRDVAIVVNGEIYNFVELRRELEGKGHSFRSRSDSETALHLYEEYGDDFAARLDGMFALLVYDARRRIVVAARDRSGKKPLYFRTLPHGVAFASEIPALVRGFPDQRPRVDLGAIDEFLTFQYVPSPRTAYADISKVEAAHVMTFSPGAPPQAKRYWSKPRGELRGTLPELEDELMRLLRVAVKKRLIADVPLGAFLSGGIDSSAIVALMSESSSRSVKTFSIGFPDAGDSELDYARLVAKRFHTDHHEAVITPDMASTLVDTIAHHGQPFADSSALATYYLAKMTREHVTVALSGDGSDEIFAGYKRYTKVRIAHVHDAFPRMARRGIDRVLGRYGNVLALPEAERYARIVGQLGPDEKGALYLDPMRDAASHDDRFASRLAASVSSSKMGRICDLDFATYLEGDINAKVDIASMTHALEVRCPFLDTAVIEFAARLPEHMLMGFRGKRVLRRAVRGLLPARTRYRVKQGFALPLERWLRRDLRTMTRDVLLDRRARERGLFRPSAVSALVDGIDTGRSNPDHVWTLLVLELWFRELVD